MIRAGQRPRMERCAMLIIRKEQMAVFEALMGERFKRRMAGHLTAAFPGPAGSMTAEDLGSVIEAGIERAAAYGITREGHVQRFLEYMFTHGPDFDTDPEISWAGEVLRMTDVDGSVKMDWIDERRRRHLEETT